LSRSAEHSSWWLLPSAVVIILPLSIWHLVRRNR
jgi:hypothetical protein